MSPETEPETEMAVDVAPGGRGRLARSTWLAALAAALLHVVVAAPFLRAQCLWTDETTQVAGMSLPPIEAARWLAGEEAGRFGVPPDRMPPLSYWLGWAWSRAFGPSERSWRWMGLAATACGTACVALAAGRLAGGRGALAAGVLFALSPNVMTVAPEIRAYPFLVAFAAASFLCLIGYAQARRETEVRWLAACLACTLAATYSHFFGLVLGGAAFASATLVALAGRRRVARPILAGVALLALSAGILPFARASSAISVEDRRDTPAETIAAFAKMCYRLIGHPAATVDPPAAGFLLAGVAGLIVVGLWPRPAGPPDDRPDAPGRPGRIRPDLLAVSLALVAGLSVTLAAGFAIRSFFVLRSSYSSWSIPGLFILAGCAFAPGAGRRLTALAVLLGASALGAEAWSDGVILAHREAFIHGPSAAIERLIASAGGDRPPIIVHEDGPSWAFLYFPIRWAHGPGLEQYLAPESGEGPPRRWPLRPLAGATRPTSLDELPAGRRVLVLRGAMMGQDAIRREIRGGGVDVPTGPLMGDLARDPAWAVERELRTFAYTAARGRLYAPREAPGATPPGPRP